VVADLFKSLAVMRDSVPAVEDSLPPGLLAQRPAAQTPPLPFRLPIKQLLLVLGVVATAYAAVLLIWGDSPGAVKTSLTRLWSFTGLQAAGLCLLGYGLRGMRWRLWMAHYGRHFGPLQGLRLYLAGYAFTPTPGNIGEAARGLMLARNPLGARHSLAIFGAERLADLTCLLLLCLPGVIWLASHEGVKNSRTVMLALAALGLVLVFGLAAALWWRAALRVRFAWLREAWHCLAVRPLVWFGLTLAAWAGQGVAAWLVCRELGVNIELMTVTGFYAVAMVAGALSALPAGLGGTEAVLTGLLAAYGAAPGMALTVTVLIRLLTLWLAVAIGVVTLLYSAAIRREISLR
jgi:glycosyltransferase 2 family protein